MAMYYATVGCPACGTRFQTPIEQIVDVRVDPQGKARAMSGTLNVAVCPACGTGGALNLPFLYHDPEKEIALLYLPMEVGKTEIERQKHAGVLTQQLMNSMAPEDRKGYLLQPETFINMESFTRRLFEIEGVSEETVQRNRAQQQFIGELLQADPEKWAELLEQHNALIDESLFALLDYIMRMTATAGEESEQFQHVQNLIQFVIEHHPIGQQIKQRSDVVRLFAENPNPETLLQALTTAQDEDTVTYLVQAGMSLMDYGFFQELLKRVENAPDDAEKKRLSELRRQILALREKVREQGMAHAQTRYELLQRLLTSTDPLKMARSHTSELDELFFTVFQNELKAAEQEQDRDYMQKLLNLMQIFEQLQEEHMPPEVVLVRRLLQAKTEEEQQELLRENRQLLHPEFFEMLEALEENAREEEQPEAAQRLSALRELAQTLTPGTRGQARGGQAKAVQSAPASDEQTTASGLIIAKR